MYLHLTDTTALIGGKYSIKQLLSIEGKREVLFSYAYKEQETQYASVWESMYLHLAESTNERGQYAVLSDEGYKSHLFSYAYQRSEQFFTPVWSEMDKRIADGTQKGLGAKPVEGARVLIDSGAFTAFTLGKEIKAQEYLAWAEGFKSRWEHKLAFLRFFTLDVIGDQDATERNQAYLEQNGLDPIPIVTFGADLKSLDEMLVKYDYIALGGLVPYRSNKVRLRSWLDACFARVMRHKKETGEMRKVHLLGVTTDWVLKRYPCYSTDSSSWVGCLRFGNGGASGIKSIPRYGEGDAAFAATIHTLRSEIRKYQRMQDEATSLWRKRGIDWEASK